MRMKKSCHLLIIPKLSRNSFCPLSIFCIQFVAIFPEMNEWMGELGRAKRRDQQQQRKRRRPPSMNAEKWGNANGAAGSHPPAPAAPSPKGHIQIFASLHQPLTFPSQTQFGGPLPPTIFATSKKEGRAILREKVEPKRRTPSTFFHQFPASFFLEAWTIYNGQREKWILFWWKWLLLLTQQYCSKNKINNIQCKINSKPNSYLQTIPLYHPPTHHHKGVNPSKSHFCVPPSFPLPPLFFRPNSKPSICIFLPSGNPSILFPFPSFIHLLDQKWPRKWPPAHKMNERHNSSTGPIAGCLLGPKHARVPFLLWGLSCFSIHPPLPHSSLLPF